MKKKLINYFESLLSQNSNSPELIICFTYDNIINTCQRIKKPLGMLDQFRLSKLIRKYKKNNWIVQKDLNGKTYFLVSDYKAIFKDLGANK